MMFLNKNWRLSFLLLKCVFVLLLVLPARVIVVVFPRPSVAQHLKVSEDIKPVLAE